MLLADKARFFVQHEMVFHAQRESGPTLPFHTTDKSLDTLSLLKAAIGTEAGQYAVKENANDVVRLTAIDVRAANDIAILLFRRSDPEAAAPVLENQRTQKLRLIQKQADEAVAVSAHLFVDLRSVDVDGHLTHRAILEEVPGLGRTYTNLVMKQILRAEKYGYEDSRGKDRDTYTVMSMRGIKSESVGGALANRGAIQHVTLVRPARVDGLDTGDQIIPQDEQMRLIIKPDTPDIFGLLKRIQGFAKGHQWKELRVRVDLPENRSRIVRFVREADAADILFVRSEHIEVDRPLPACTDTISEQLVVKAIELFNNSSAWPK